MNGTLKAEIRQGARGVVEAKIREKLTHGITPTQLISQGYKKSTVYKVWNSLKPAPPTTDAEQLQSALKKLTQEELRVVFEVGALLHDPMSRELLRKLVE